MSLYNPGIPVSEKGAPGGVAALDENAKVPVAFLPDAIVSGFKFKGNWNAATNTPTLGDGGGGGLNGDVYRVSVAGTTLIDGEGDWQIRDLIMRTDTVWIKADNTDPFNYAEYQGNEDVGIGGGSGWEIVKAFTFAGLTPGTE